MARISSPKILKVPKNIACKCTHMDIDALILYPSPGVVEQGVDGILVPELPPRQAAGAGP